MQYNELGGRSTAVQSSALRMSVNFTDMTIDTQGLSRHPDRMQWLQRH